mgnify:CR=1 FL=1
MLVMLRQKGMRRPYIKPIQPSFIVSSLIEKPAQPLHCDHTLLLDQAPSHHHIPTPFPGSLVTSKRCHL